MGRFKAEMGATRGCRLEETRAHATLGVAALPAQWCASIVQGRCRRVSLATNPRLSVGPRGDDENWNVLDL